MNLVLLFSDRGDGRASRLQDASDRRIQTGELQLEILLYFVKNEKNNQIRTFVGYVSAVL